MIIILKAKASEHGGNDIFKTYYVGEKSLMLLLKYGFAIVT